VLDGLDAVQYEFTRSGESHVGFIAENVPDEVSNATHTSLKVVDIVSVLACVVKEQRETIARLEARVASLEARGQ
jgi:BMFP domain-containing protein YqiC